MITEVQDHSEAGLGSLVSGIVDDCRDLVRQEFLLARQRIAEDLQKTRDATVAWALGGGVLLLSGIAFCFMVVHLLHAMTSPAGLDPASIPLWACYGIVGALLAVAGAAALVFGRRKIESLRLIDGAASKEVPND